MDCIGYRISGELSDITVVIDGEEFHLHKFPLFVRSNFFKNLSHLQTETKSRVELDNFPGGARTFEIIADYCYSKEVNVNLNNVVSVKCGAEYLEMTGGSGRGGLVMLADNVLFDILYSAKTKRDYYLTLLLLDKCSKYSYYADKCGLSQKLLDSFVENLNLFIKTASVYESINLYEKNSHPKISLHSLSIGEEHLKILNKLPLNWINDLIKTSVRFNLNQSLLSYIVQNYIDYNTGLNPNYSVDVPQEHQQRTSNLISVAANIIKIDKKFADLAYSEQEKKSTELISIASDILEPKSSNNLIKIAGDILEPKPNNLIQIASDVLEPKPNNLIQIASDVLEPKPSNLIQIASDVLEPKPSNLIEIAGNILEPTPSLNLTEIASDVRNKEKPTNLLKIASDVLEAEVEPEAPKNLINIATDILEPEEKKLNLAKITSELIDHTQEVEKNIYLAINATDNERLDIITQLTHSLNDSRIEPQFSISWLLIYMNALHNLNADQSVKSSFNKWTWSALNDLKSNSKELSNVPPSIMIQLAQDISNRDYTSSSKLIELVDRYVEDLEKENKLNPDTFIELISTIPKDKRNSYDSLTRIVLNLFDKENHSINLDKQKEILNLIEFNKVNEQTLEECKKSDYIPQQYITEAALSLCTRLRKELDETKSLLKSYETSKTRSTARTSDTYSNYSSSSKYNVMRNRSSDPRSSTGESTSRREITNSTTNKITYPSSYSSLTTSSLSSLSSGSYKPYSARSSYATSSITPRTTMPSTSTSRIKNYNNYNSSASYKSARNYYSYLENDYDIDQFDYIDDNDVYDTLYGYSKIY